VNPTGIGTYTGWASTADRRGPTTEEPGSAAPSNVSAAPRGHAVTDAELDHELDRRREMLQAQIALLLEGVRTDAATTRRIRRRRPAG
jgi:hypothetical protein